MIYIIAFATTGGSVILLRNSAAVGALIAVVAGFILMAIGGALTWVDSIAGIDAFMIRSWQVLSGVHSAGQVVLSCTPRPTAGNGLLILLMLILVIVNIAIGCIAILGIPIGIGTSLYGMPSAIFERDGEIFIKGLTILAVALGAVIVAGVFMRFEHMLSVSFCH